MPHTILQILSKEEMYQFDYIVVGGGLAGLYTAHRAALTGATVAIITKEDITDSNSYYAQGGIAAVTAEDDKPSNHFEDTIEAGRGLCDEEAVRILTEEAPQRIRELIALGMHFDVEAGGDLSLGLEGGHRHKRILHAGGDSTGRKVTEFMIEEVKRDKRIRLFTERQAVHLLVDDEGCYGVSVWNWSKDCEEVYCGKHIVMATGGSAAIYDRTTNPNVSIGDGIAICYHAGCKVRDLEFVQFHPTALYSEMGHSFLISEAVRGEGAHLLNSRGERFMPGVHELAELAPRDVVARQIFQEMQRLDDNFVYLSLAHLDKDIIRHRFPTITQHCKQLGLDFTDKIPVVPAAHYTVGGVVTDLYGRTTVPHLYAVGELASTGIMGANRLASNSLIECLVFGHRVVEDARVQVGHSLTSYACNAHLPRPLSSELYEKIKHDLAKTMMNYVGIVRDAPGLEKALHQIEEMRHLLDLSAASNLYSRFAAQLLDVGELVTRGAIQRKESRGGHYRRDYPEPREEYKRHLENRLK